MVTIISNTVLEYCIVLLYTRNRVRHSQNKNKNDNCEMMDELINFIVVIISQCISSVQFSSVAQLCLTLCNPMNHSTPGLPVHHQLPQVTQTCVH